MMLIRALFQIFLIISFSFVSAHFSSAAEDTVYCLEKTTSGGTCIESSSLNENGGGMTFPGSCSQAPFCQSGCCVTQSDGCFVNTAQPSCTVLGGVWKENAQCSYSECQKGCCTLGSQADVRTLSSCQALTEKAGLSNVQFDSSAVDPIQCQQSVLADVSGCCVQPSGLCTQTSPSDCLSGDYRYAIQCSDSSLSSVCSSCQGPKKKVCVDFSADVYWQDSCGNLAGVANTCEVSSAFCSAENGEAACVSSTCTDVWDNPRVDENRDGTYDNDATLVRKNYESWCEYQGNVGPAIDLPGSQHFKWRCRNGEVTSELCFSGGTKMRSSYCAETTVSLPDGTSMNEAFCVPLKGEDCYAQKRRSDCENQQARTCLWVPHNQEDVVRLQAQVRENFLHNFGKNVTLVSSSESTDGICLPLIPPAFAFWDVASENSCDLASDSSRYTAYWEKIVEWDCEAGCSLYTPAFAQSMNALCVAQGDCGASYNLVGTWTDNGFSRTCPDKGDNTGTSDGLTDCVSCPGDVNDAAVSGYGDDEADDLLRVCADTRYLSEPSSHTFNQDYRLYTNTLDVPEIVLGTAFDTVGFFKAMTIGSAAVGSGLVALKTLVLSSATLTVAGVGAIIGAAVLLITSLIFGILAGISDDYEGTAEVTCGLWQAPQGDAFCRLCNEAGTDALGNAVDFTGNGKQECTEYLCRSLGQGCQFIPDTVKGPACEKGATLLPSPRLEALTDVMITHNQCVGGVCQIQTSDTGFTLTTPLKSYTPVTLAFRSTDGTADMFARCKFTDTFGTDYGAMADWDSSFAVDHQKMFQFKDMVGKKELLDGQSYTLHVRCENTQDHVMPNDFIISFSTEAGPDSVGPHILTVDPEKGLVQSGTSALQVLLTLNEEASCTYSPQSLPYDLMTSSFGCDASKTCVASLPVLNETITYYFVCEDTNGNPSQMRSYDVRQTPPLAIFSISCEREGETSCLSPIYSSQFTFSVALEGGSGEDYACEVQEKGTSILFPLQGDGFLLTQPLGPLSLGEHTYTVSCEDSVGNEVSEDVTFTYVQDVLPPQYVALHAEDGLFTVQTDESAVCTDVGQEKPFVVTGGTLHQTPLSTDYILLSCVDVRNNLALPLNVYF